MDEQLECVREEIEKVVQYCERGEEGERKNVIVDSEMVSFHSETFTLLFSFTLSIFLLPSSIFLFFEFSQAERCWFFLPSLSLSILFSNQVKIYQYMYASLMHH